MNKVVMLLNINSMNMLPAMERWLLQTHAAESVSRIGPWLTRYQSYRAVPPPPQMHADVERFGYYNWRVTELWSRDPYPQHGILAQEFFPDYARILGLPTDVADAEKWSGRPEGPRQSVRCVVPARATEDFKGADKPLKDYRSVLRWFTVSKLPPAVTVEEADRWYLHVHAKEVLQQPGLTRFTSHSVNPPAGRSWSWYRLSELWYEDFDAWRFAVIESPPKYTRPSWATHDEYPFFFPYVDFASTFLLESPTNTFLPHFGDYLVSV
jgi:hypothetical protein